MLAIIEIPIQIVAEYAELQIPVGDVSKVIHFQVSKAFLPEWRFRVLTSTSNRFTLAHHLVQTYIIKNSTKLGVLKLYRYSVKCNSKLTLQCDTVRILWHEVLQQQQHTYFCKCVVALLTIIFGTEVTACWVVAILHKVCWGCDHWSQLCCKINFLFFVGNLWEVHKKLC